MAGICMMKRKSNTSNTNNKIKSEGTGKKKED